MTSLLADVVATRHLPPEPVATAALVHLLGRSSAGRVAVTKIFDDLSLSRSASVLTFTEQVVDSDHDGRPDLVGSDIGGPRMVVEAKFDAELTTIQRTQAYEARIVEGRGGLILFLVPEDRLMAIWPELMAGPGKHTVESEAFPRNRDGVLATPLRSGNVLAVTSWEHLIAVLRDAMAVAGEERNLADLMQLEGLVSWRSRSGWTPLLPGDLPARAGRQLWALVGAVVRAAREASTNTTAGSSDNASGRYVTSPNGRTIWCGLWLSAWSEHGVSPVWAQVRATKLQPVDLLAERLGEFPGLLPRHANGDVIVPLNLPRGAEMDTLTAAIKSQLIALFQALDTLPHEDSGEADTLPALLED